MTQHGKDRRKLRARAHALKPVVTVGAAGVTDGVVSELEQALWHHELLKVKVAGADRQGRQTVAETLCEATGAELVQSIGHVLVLYRERPEDSGERHSSTGQPSHRASASPSSRQK